MTALFQVVMGLADLALWSAARAERSWLRLSVLAMGWAAALSLSAGFFASVSGRGAFWFLRLACHGVFLHAPLVLVAAGWTWRTSKLRALLVAGTAAAMLLVGAHAFLVEPTWLEVTHHQIDSPELREPVRVVVLADLQTDRFGDYERAVFRRILLQEPDLVLLPGDYLQVADRERREALRDSFNSYLREIRFGTAFEVLAVRGDVEGPGWAKLFEGLPVETFEHTRTVRRLGLTITALSPEDSRSRRLALPPASGFHVVFGHDPAFALDPLDADLLLAGHTHGGQVRLPGIGPLLTLSQVPRAWAAGRTDLAGGRTLIVSRGVGMERGWAPRLRFLCRPELVVVDLRPAPG